MAMPVYLDYNATAPVRPEAIAAVAATMAEVGNPSSVHRFGRAARRVVETAREAVAALVGAEPAQVVFTAGGTEANNLALASSGRVLASAIEHDSVLRPVGEAPRIPVGGAGVIDLAALERMLAEHAPTLAAVMLANNETGVIQPVAEAARLAHARGALIHCDAAQAAGKVAIDFAALGVDTLALSAHKLGGPQGVGALIVAPHVALRPAMLGGGQERGRRAGTESVAAIAGFGVAATLANAERVRSVDVARLRDDMERRVRQAVPVAPIHGEAALRLPNTSCLGMPGVAAETQVMALDLAGIAVSAGAACSSGKVKASHVLAAMGVPEAVANGAIRVSSGWRTTADDWTRFVEAWISLWVRLGAHRADQAAPAA